MVAIKVLLLGSFLVGIALAVLPLILYPAFAQLGIASASFPNVDYNIVGSILHWIIEFLKVSLNFSLIRNMNDFKNIAFGKK